MMIAKSDVEILKANPGIETDWYYGQWRAWLASNPEGYVGYGSSEQIAIQDLLEDIYDRNVQQSQ